MERVGHRSRGRFAGGRRDHACLLQWKILKGCPTLLLARYRAEGPDPALQTATAFFAVAGLCAGAEIPIGPRVWGFLWAEGLVNLTRHDLWLGGDRIWQVPPFGFTLSAGAVASIL